MSTPFPFRSYLPAIAPLFATLLGASSVSADAAGDKAIGAVDAAVNRAKTQYLEYEVVNQEPGKSEKKLGLKVYVKGAKRLTEFLAPADMKGTKILIESPTQMYVYLPAFGKVRRIASHVNDQGFMGLAFTPDDLANQTLAPSYDVTIAGDAGNEQKLVLAAKAGQTVSYPKIEMTVLKDKSVPSELKYYNAAGTHVKTETRSDYSCESGVCTPRELKMVDHSKGGHYTRMIRKEWKVNQTIEDSVFSKRNLEK